MKGTLLLSLLMALAVMLSQCVRVRGTANDQPILSQMAASGIVSRLEERSTMGATSKDGKTPFMSFIARKRRATSSISKKPAPFCAGCFSVIGDPTRTRL